MRSAHCRSVSHGSNRPISAYANAELVAIVACVKGLKADNGNKENIISDAENARMCVFFLCLDIMQQTDKLGRRSNPAIQSSDHQ